MAKVDTLKEIVRKKKERLALAKQSLAEEELKEKAKAVQPCRPFIEAINKPRNICLIAEIKKASPSAGVIRENFSHQEIACIYQDAGAQAISILTEEDYFSGSLSYLAEVKSLVSLPVLRKDFILEPYQVYESRLYGADAVLLIAELLTKDTLVQLMQTAEGLGMDCLVEVHDEKQLKKILNLKEVRLIGINNRSLHTLELDFKITEKLFPLIPKDKVVVVESGVKTSQDILFLRILGVNAVLIGTAFMQSPDITRKIEELMGW
ncbi:MAG: indole-3-glycerol phosphate synthase TrpC [Candidatus Omnitrophica bacterium]|nr:indole-3-glycerol phosphate synthase TrpC [Candidatus Omnitrophota bacterium]